MYFRKKTIKMYKKSAPKVFFHSVFPRGHAKKKLFARLPPHVCLI